MKFAMLIAMLALTGCKAPVWRGASVGVQAVSVMDNRYRLDNAGSGYLFFAWGVVGGGTAHIQPIFPMNGNTPIVGVGVDWPIPFLKGKRSTCE